MNATDESGRHDPDLLREALERAMNKRSHPYPPIRGCEKDRLVCAMAVVVLSPFLIRQINKKKLDISGLIRDLCERMRKCLTQLGPEYADWVNRHLASDEATTEAEVMEILIQADQRIPGLMPIYFSQTGEQLRIVGKEARRFRDNYIHDGRVYRRDDVEMVFRDGSWQVQGSTLEETAMLFDELPPHLEKELTLLRDSFDNHFGRDDISGVWGTLPSMPLGNSPLVLDDDDAELEQFLDAASEGSNHPQPAQEAGVEEDDPEEDSETLFDADPDATVADPPGSVDDDVADLFGDDDEDEVVSLEEATPEERAAILEAQRQKDEDDDFDPEFAAQLQAKIEADQAEQERRAKEHAYQADLKEGGVAELLERVAKQAAGAPGTSSARLKRASDDGVTEKPLKIPGDDSDDDPQTITRAVARLGPEEEEEAVSGSRTHVLPPPDQTFDTLTGDPTPRIPTRNMGIKGATPTLEEGGDDSDPSLVEGEEQPEPPKVGGEDPARALTRTSMSIDTPTKEQPTKEDNMSDTDTPEHMLEARRVELDEKGEIIGRDKELVKHPLSKWTDPATGKLSLLGADPNRCQYRASDGKVEKFLDLIALAEDLDVMYEHPLASQSNPDLMLSSRAPGSGDEDEDEEDFELDTSNIQFADPDRGDDEEDEELELEPPLSGSSDAVPALPGDLASTEPPFAGNKDEDLSQGGEDLENTTSSGEQPKDTTPKKEDDMSNDKQEPDNNPDDATKPEETTATAAKPETPAKPNDDSKETSEAKPESSDDKPKKGKKAKKDKKKGKKKSKKDKTKPAATNVDNPDEGKNKDDGSEGENKDDGKDSKNDPEDGDGKDNDGETRRLKKVPMINVRGDFNGDGELVVNEVPLAYVFVGDNNIDGYNDGATSFKFGDDLFNQATLKQGEDTMNVFPLNEVKLVEVVLRTEDGTLSNEKVNEQLLRDPNDAEARIYLNEEMSEFMNGNNAIGARAHLVNESGKVVAQALAPNNAGTQRMLAAAGNDEGGQPDDTSGTSRWQRIQNAMWSEQSTGQRLLRTGVPALLLLALAAFLLWPSGDKPNSLVAFEQNWLPTRGSKEIAKGHRELKSHEGLRADLVFPWPGEEYKNAITKENVKQVVRLMPQYNQQWRDDIRGFHVAYSVDDSFCNEIAGRYGLDHPVWRMGIPMAQFTVIGTHDDNVPARKVSITPIVTKTDRIVAIQYEITVSKAYKLELDKAEAISPEAYDRALPRVLYTRYHVPLPEPRITSQ